AQPDRVDAVMGQWPPALAQEPAHAAELARIALTPGEAAGLGVEADLQASLQAARGAQRLAADGEDQGAVARPAQVDAAVAVENRQRQEQHEEQGRDRRHPGPLPGRSLV